MKPRSRRDFLRLGATTLASSALLSSIAGWRRVLAATTGPDVTGYKALVCLYMYGGNDGFNWFVPISDAGYQAYTASRGNVALSQSDLLPLYGTGGSASPVMAQDGSGSGAMGLYGIHPGCPEMQTLFNSGNLAVLGNVGTLITPTATPQTIQANTAQLPSQLFSHIDQMIQWQTSPGTENSGWAGRIADLYDSQGYAPSLAMNIDVGGANYLQQGAQTNMYVLGTSGAPVLDDTSNVSYRSGLRAQTADALLSLAQSDGNLLVQQYAAIQQRAADKVTLVNTALSSAGDLTTTFPSYAGDTGLGAQLHEVARVIKAQSQIGDARQIFFVSIDGFDTHTNLVPVQAQLLPIVSKNLSTFWAAMTEIGMTNNVTLFTATEFGRTLGSNGTGTDHAWGNHHVILGGAVQGGQFYGTMPSLVIGGANDYGADLGQLVPTTSTDQYAATLAAWFGVPSASLATVFPNLSNFVSANLSITLPFLGTVSA